MAGGRGQARGEKEELQMLRSEDMSLYQMIIPSESAHETVRELGELGLLQFKDLNKDKSEFQRMYAGQVKRCEEMLRKLRYFSSQIEEAGVPVPPPSAQTDEERSMSLDELEMKLEELESETSQLSANTQNLQRSYNELIEVQMVVEKAGAFFQEARADARIRQEEYARDERSRVESPSEPLLSATEQQAQAQPPGGESKSVRLGYVTGVIATDKLNSFERILFRATRGNMYLRQAPIDGKITDPNTGEKVEKSVFCVFFAGERARSKINKICEAFQANRYAFPEEQSRQRQMKAEVMERLREVKTTLDASLQYRNDSLQTIANQLQDWFVIVRREKTIYHTHNKLSVDVTQQCFIAEAWGPASASDTIQNALHQGQKRANSQVSTIIQPKPTKEMPPTYFQTDNVTEAFQTIIDAYGTPNYKEANPALFSVVTFPFLFAVMFGDFGHGIIMLLAALYVVLNERKLKKTAQENEIFGMMYGGRYVILLMAIFSIYVGALYNECMALPMKLFGESVYGESGLKKGELDTDNSTNSNVYPFGVDPAWLEAENSLTFLNSLKMKASIILGVCQMTLGLVHSLLNHLYNKDFLGVWFEFIPQTLLLLCMFGYLSLLIVLKWVTPRGEQGATADLYGVMIQMFLNPGNVGDSNKLFEGQGGLQIFFLLIMLVSIPTMLLPKPLILKRRYEKQLKGYGQVSTSPETEDEVKLEEGTGAEEEEEEEGFNFGETMVHQMIHTIEFVIGVVSNTASYLRLWALSLAHAQLSKVFYNMVLITSISYDSVPLMVVGTAVFACATFGVLMIMESLSAFLHCLREFQNKFYTGEGIAFKPLMLDQESLLEMGES